LAARAAGVGVDYLGEVASLDAVYAISRVSIAPVRFGSGVKGKVIEAALHGLPVIGTTVAWEGIEVAPGVSGVVADDETGFAVAIEALLESNEDRREMVEESGRWLTPFASQFYSDILRDAVGVRHA
jgi:glycosyltransferase involved in cell wall biosynthesis